MKNYSRGNMPSEREKAIEAKQYIESLNSTEENNTGIKITTGECGLENPCVFGEHNPNFKSEV